MGDPQETLIPFAELPACAVDCGPLFDANGGCVPPFFPVGTEEDYINCFCTHDKLAGFRTGTTGVCDNVCSDEGADATADTLAAIQSWFAETCGVAVADSTANNEEDTTADDSTTTSNPTTTTSTSNDGEGDWLSAHWKWVVMLAILVVGISAVWIGACMWRRHYLKKKERAHALGKKGSRASGHHASWGPGVAPPDLHLAGAGAFMSPANQHPTYGEKQKKSKWIVKERT